MWYSRFQQPARTKIFMDDCPRTETNIEIIKGDVRSTSGYTPSTEGIWRSFRHRDLSPSFRYYAWMATDDAYMIGSNWQRSNYRDELQERAICQACGMLETMDHILLRCSEPDVETVWNLAEELWYKRNEPGTWPDVTLGTILGCTLLRLPNVEKKKKRKGNERLFLGFSESWCQKQLTWDGKSTGQGRLKEDGRERDRPGSSKEHVDLRY
jgi:hypothetical protein